MTKAKSKNPKIVLIHSLDVSPQIVVAPSMYAPNQTAYLMIDKDSQDFLTMVRDSYYFEKMVNEWRHKYDRLLQGLNYWKMKALENASIK